MWEIDWNVNCRAVGESSASLKYLSPYVFKVAISDSRIVVDRDTIGGLIELAHGFDLQEPEIELEPWEPMVCRHCGGPLKLFAIVLKNGTVIYVRPRGGKPHKEVASRANSLRPILWIS